MPNIRSAIKKARHDVRRYAENRVYRSRIHTLTRRVLEQIAAKDKDGAAKSLQIAQSVIDKAAKRHVIHKKNAAHKISRLRRRLGLVAQSQ